MSYGSPFLIVTRDLTAQDTYVRLLRAERLATLGANTWEEAARIGRFAPPTAVLFDIERGDDWMSLARLRHELPDDVPIVILCQWVAQDRTCRNLARDLGCAAFVQKPAAASLVLGALRRAANGSAWSEYVDV